MTAALILLLGVTVAGYGPGRKSQKYLVARYEREAATRDGSLTYLFREPYSAQFYSSGNAHLLETAQSVEPRLGRPCLERLTEVDRFDDYILLTDKVRTSTR